MSGIVEADPLRPSLDREHAAPLAVTARAKKTENSEAAVSQILRSVPALATSIGI